MGEYKSVKIKSDVYKQIKEMGVGISKAVELLLKEQEKKIEEKFADLEEIAGELGKIMIEEGFFSIKFKGFKISEVKEVGEDVVISGTVAIGINNANARKLLIEKLKPKEEEESG